MSKKAMWACAVAASFFAICIALVTFYLVRYSSVALPHVSVSGIVVQDMSKPEIVKVLDAKLTKARVAATIDSKEEVVSLSEAGVDVDVDATATAAMQYNLSPVDKFKALFENRSFPIVYKLKDSAFKAYCEKLTEKYGTKAIQPSVVVSDDGAQFVAKAGQSGKAIDTKALKTALEKSVQNLTVEKVTVSLQDVNPTISMDAITVKANDFNAMINSEVTLGNGKTRYTAKPATKMGWIRVTENPTDPTDISAKLDEEKVKQWVVKAAGDLTIPRIDGIGNVNGAGTILSYAVQPVDGLKPVNVDSMAVQVINAFKSHQNFSSNFTFETDKAQLTTRKVLPGGEHLAYAATEGQKWIDVNLSQRTATAYVGITPVHGPVPILHGNNNFPTILGAYPIYIKNIKQDMGCTAKYNYCSRNVPYAMFFKGDFGLHAAPWHNTFGWANPNGGSHGCVNLSIPDAQWFYNWAEIGTMVVTHR